MKRNKFQEIKEHKEHRDQVLEYGGRTSCEGRGALSRKLMAVKKFVSSFGTQRKQVSSPGKSLSFAEIFRTTWGV